MTTGRFVVISEREMEISFLGVKRSLTVKREKCLGAAVLGGVATARMERTEVATMVTVC